jgi:uncharacterized protein
MVQAMAMPKVNTIIKHIGWLWITSAAVCEEGGTAPFSRRVRFLLKALAQYGSIKPMVDAPRESALGRLMRERPLTVGAVIWPYQCAAWNAQTRLARIRDHYAVIEKIGGVIDFPVTGKILLADLGELRDGFYVSIDQPLWLFREGQLTLNLFVGDTRVYTLSFSLFSESNAFGAFIGAIQGRDIEGALDEYRELTKACHGMRPRDLLIEIFRMLCAELHIGKILAVSDECRHQRDLRYFPKTEFHSNYDAIWTDRGGTRVDATCFELEVDQPERDLATVPAKKRGMYRRRFEMLRGVRRQIHERCSRPNPTQAELGDAREVEFSLLGHGAGS